MSDINFIDFMLKMIIVAGISAILLLLGAVAGIAYYIIWRKKK